MKTAEENWRERALAAEAKLTVTRKWAARWKRVCKSDYRSARLDAEIERIEAEIQAQKGKLEVARLTALLNRSSR